jgi:membrane fusion protein, multidrug efflux system
MKKKIFIIAVAIICTVLFVVKLAINKKNIDEATKPKSLHIAVPVVTDTVKYITLDNSFSVNGSFAPSHELIIMGETSGKIIEVNFETGDYVKEGQVLASLDIDILNAQKQLAEANLNKTKGDLSKFEQMIKTNAISQQQLEEMKLAYINAQTSLTTVKKQLEYSVVKAPFSGYITKKYIERGGMMLPGSPIAEIVDINTLKFIASVAESDISRVKKNQEILVKCDADNTIEFKARVKAISVKADESKRYTVESEIKNNASNPVKAGMYGTAFFHSNGTRQALVIPRSGLTGSIKNAKVYIAEGNKAILKSITTAYTDDKIIEVTEGLLPGQLVITSGQINLENNTLIETSKKK